MAKTLLQFQNPVTGPDARLYRARACGTETARGTWEGWIEFDLLAAPTGLTTVRSPRETTQPNRTSAEYWATGLTSVYLEGALIRALEPALPTPVEVVDDPVFDRPAASGSHGGASDTACTPAILDPFSVYEKGEALLRRQLNALSAWHLVNIIVNYELSDENSASLSREPAGALVEIIVAQVQARLAARD